MGYRLIESAKNFDFRENDPQLVLKAGTKWSLIHGVTTLDVLNYGF